MYLGTTDIVRVELVGSRVIDEIKLTVRHDLPYLCSNQWCEERNRLVQRKDSEDVWSRGPSGYFHGLVVSVNMLLTWWTKCSSTLSSISEWLPKTFTQVGTDRALSFILGLAGGQLGMSLSHIDWENTGMMNRAASVWQHRVSHCGCSQVRGGRQYLVLSCCEYRENSLQENQIRGDKVSAESFRQIGPDVFVVSWYICRVRNDM